MSLPTYIVLTTAATICSIDTHTHRHRHTHTDRHNKSACWVLQRTTNVARLEFRDWQVCHLKIADCIAAQEVESCVKTPMEQRRLSDHVLAEQTILFPTIARGISWTPIPVTRDNAVAIRVGPLSSQVEENKTKQQQNRSSIKSKVDHKINVVGGHVDAIDVSALGVGFTCCGKMWNNLFFCLSALGNCVGCPSLTQNAISLQSKVVCPVRMSLLPNTISTSMKCQGSAKHVPFALHNHKSISKTTTTTTTTTTERRRKKNIPIGRFSFLCVPSNSTCMSCGIAAFCTFIRTTTTTVGEDRQIPDALSAI